jgi:hypothetical protein
MAHDAIRTPAGLRMAIVQRFTGTIEDVKAKNELCRQAEEGANQLRPLADALLVPSLEINARRRRALAASLATQATHGPQNVALTPEMKALFGPHRPFHWPLEFPEVLLSSRAGFDAVVGNPPFMGGQKITGNLGQGYRQYLVEHLAQGARGSADLAAYFFLRVYSLLAPGGTMTMIAVNTIAEGDTRQVGLERLVAKGAGIYRAWPNEPWPNDAAVVTSRVGMRKGDWNGCLEIHDQEVERITPFLTDEDVRTPHRLRENANLSFQGSIVLGMGFTVNEGQARAWIEEDPANADVLFPYLNGEDLTTHPEQKSSRWVISFWDWPEDRARQYEKPFDQVERLVKPERDRNNRAVYRNNWWQFAEKRPTLYHAIGRGHLFVEHPDDWEEGNRSAAIIAVLSRVSKYGMAVLVSNEIIPSEGIVVFPVESLFRIYCVQSSFHIIWSYKMSSSLETRLRYSPSDCFETYPFPRCPDNVTERVEEIGREYQRKRSVIMNNNQIGITDLYNLFHDPEVNIAGISDLRELHCRLDEAIAEAYGWVELELEHDFHRVSYLPENDNLRFTISERARREVLSRLLDLNDQRYAAEQAAAAEAAQGPDAAPAPRRRARPAATLTLPENAPVRQEQGSLFSSIPRGRS